MEISGCVSAGGPYTCARFDFKSPGAYGKLSKFVRRFYRSARRFGAICMGMKRLDLHGVRHADVALKVEDFLLRAALPAEIITGNSTHNQQTVARTVRTLGLYSFHPHPNNLGSVMVTEGL
ncbi:MAG: hypothetical protein ACI8W8_000182 [Rhodothermales bacterium]|jgi:hypothetical protein